MICIDQYTPKTSSDASCGFQAWFIVLGILMVCVSWLMISLNTFMAIFLRQKLDPSVWGPISIVSIFFFPVLGASLQFVEDFPFRPPFVACFSFVKWWVFGVYYGIVCICDFFCGTFHWVCYLRAPKY